MDIEKLELFSEVPKADIHSSYGGNTRSGIVPTKNYPFIFLFHTESGERYGYEDSWIDDKYLIYTGEGQAGDMRIEKGVNRRLIDHKEEGNRVFFFRKVRRKGGIYRFEGELEIEGFNIEPGRDMANSLRNRIKFLFKRKLKPLYSTSTEGISAQEGFYDPKDANTTRKGLVTTRVGQGIYREYLLRKWGRKCAVTGYSDERILIASHILPWKNSNNRQRLDIENGLVLSPDYDALFDKHLISFENSGKIILSDELGKMTYQSLGVTGKERIRNLTDGNKEYLEIHRGSL